MKEMTLYVVNIVLLNCIKYIIKSNIEIIANLEIIAILK